MVKDLVIMAAVAHLAVGCGPGADLEKRIIDGTPEALAQVLPQGIFHSRSAESGLLPAAPTAREVTALGKADGYDPRDAHPTYAFTGAPDDVLGLPGEFEPAQALLLGLPYDGAELEPFFAELIDQAQSEVNSVVIYTSSSRVASDLDWALKDRGVDTKNVYYTILKLDSIWIRDYGPLVVRTNDGGYRVVDLRYYYGRWSDDAVPTLLAEAWDLPVSRPPLESEGGNFLSDGAGRCISTEQVVYQNQRRGYDEQSIKAIYRDYLGCTTTVLLPALSGEGTGHVDMFATITGPGEVLVGEYDDQDDVQNAQVLDQAAAMLDAAGFTVRRLPMPTNHDGNYRSYTNSLAIGDKVLVPVYADDRRYEDEALAAFAEAYPDHTIVPLDATEIIRWAGAIHCVTMTVGS